ncbi:IS30 family (Tra8) [Fructobacillus cardui]|nr:IS30 family (Tra8) [Fructobacillus cardui]
MVINDKFAYTASTATANLCKKYKGCVDSVTCDRGSEFIALQTRQMLNQHGVKYYYAHAYSSYERGSNENFNKLLREYYSKKTDFAHISQSEIDKVVMSITITTHVRCEHIFTGVVCRLLDVIANIVVLRLTSGS